MYKLGSLVFVRIRNVIAYAVVVSVRDVKLIDVDIIIPIIHCDIVIPKKNEVALNMTVRQLVNVLNIRRDLNYEITMERHRSETYEQICET